MMDDIIYTTQLSIYGLPHHSRTHRHMNDSLQKTHTDYSSKMANGCLHEHRCKNEIIYRFVNIGLIRQTSFFTAYISTIHFFSFFHLQNRLQWSFFCVILHIAHNSLQKNIQQILNIMNQLGWDLMSHPKIHYARGSQKKKSLLHPKFHSFSAHLMLWCTCTYLARKLLLWYWNVQLPHNWPHDVVQPQNFVHYIYPIFAIVRVCCIYLYNYTRKMDLVIRQTTTKCIFSLWSNTHMLFSQLPNASP